MAGVKSRGITSIRGAEVKADWGDGEVLQAEAGSGSGERTTEIEKIGKQEEIWC